MKQRGDARRLVHTPADMSNELVEWARQNKRDPGIPFGIPAIDKRVIPLRPGDLVSVIGRPGHAKTSVLAYLARETGKRIRDAGDESHVVVYVTWEQSCEELAALFIADTGLSVADIAWGRTDVDTVIRKAIKAVSVPIWVIGHGIGRAGENVPRMTTDVVLAAIETMEEDYGVKPALMLFDYMQLIPVRDARDRVQQVTEVPILVKELALRIGAPAVVGVQASREVDSRDIKLPEMRDAQWASSIEQTSDKVFSLWRPKLTETVRVIRLGEQEYEVTDNLLLMRLLKQRGEQGRHTWGLYFDPAYLKLAELEMRTGH